MDAFYIIFSIIATIITLIVPPYLDGIARKVKARIQYRRGPPFTQTWYDLMKLFKLPSIMPTKSLIFKIMPYFALASAFIAALMLPFGTYAPLNYSNNLIVFFYAILLVSVAMVLAGFAVQNAFSHIGSARELILIMTIEPLLGIVYGIFAYNAGSLNILNMAVNLKLRISLILAYIILFYSIYAECGFIPFDVTEAEQEVIGGPLAEYSGRLLGVFYYALYMRRFALLWLYSTLLVLPFASSLSPRTAAIALPLQLLLVVSLYVLIAALEATNARLRVDHIVKMNVKILFASVIILAASLVGW